MRSRPVFSCIAYASFVSTFVVTFHVQICIELCPSLSDYLMLMSDLYAFVYIHYIKRCSFLYFVEINLKNQKNVLLLELINVKRNPFAFISRNQILYLFRFRPFRHTYNFLHQSNRSHQRNFSFFSFQKRILFSSIDMDSLRLGHEEILTLVIHNPVIHSHS